MLGKRKELIYRIKGFSSLLLKRSVSQALGLRPCFALQYNKSFVYLCLKFNFEFLFRNSVRSVTNL